MRLFHFSDDPGIERFEPRPVLVPSARAPGREWLNGPLVWAIDEPHQPMYLFPRDCPRILLWPRPETTAQDLERWWGGSPCRMIAHVEEAWLERLSKASIIRYELPTDPFESLDDAGMWVSRQAVTPVAVAEIRDLPGALRDQDVELRVMDSLTPLRDVWSSSLHASGIRLRNARGWNAPPSPAPVLFPSPPLGGEVG
jgi:hypothetical protein